MPRLYQKGSSRVRSDEDSSSEYGSRSRENGGGVGWRLVV